MLSRWFFHISRSIVLWLTYVSLLSSSAMKGQRSLGIVIKLGKFDEGPPSPPSDRSNILPSGTSSIVDEKSHEPLLSILTLIVETAVKLRKDGHKVVIVSSGAIGVGLRRMDIDKRPKHMSQLQVRSPQPAALPKLACLSQFEQALAAIGQCRLMSLWDSLFTHLRQPIAQILLTRNDIADVSEGKTSLASLPSCAYQDSLTCMGQKRSRYFKCPKYIQ